MKGMPPQDIEQGSLTNDGQEKNLSTKNAGATGWGHLDIAGVILVPATDTTGADCRGEERKVDG